MNTDQGTVRGIVEGDMDKVQEMWVFESSILCYFSLSQ